MAEMGRDHEDDNDIEEYNNKYDIIIVGQRKDKLLLQWFMCKSWAHDDCLAPDVDKPWYRPC